MARNDVGPRDGTPRPTGWRVRLRALWRALVVVRRLLPLLVALLRDRRRYLLFGGPREPTADDRRRRARFLKEEFVDLGPAFVKLGQILSTRPDVLPGEYVAVLSELQDRVPPDPWAAVRGTIEAELGPVEERFDEFDTDPISGASLGQVYRATVDGRPVAVKVLRPGVRERVEADLRVLGVIVPFLARHSRPGQAFTLSNLADEFAETVREEMDYAREAAMLREIGATFADDDRVRIPEPLADLCTDRVVTMEYVDGVKIDDVEAIDAMGLDREALVRRLEDAYIRMIVEEGLFHADPHPGNLAVRDDGTIVFYDFGMTGRLDARTREQLQEFYVGLATNDIDRVIDAFEAMGALDPAADRRLVREVFEVAVDEFRGEGIDDYRIEELIEGFEDAVYEFPLRIPQDLALVVRVTTVLEGVARTLDPDFDFVSVITDYVTEEGLADDDGAAEAVAAAVRERASATLRSSVRLPTKLDRALEVARRGNLRVAADIADSGGAFARLGRRLFLGFVVAAGAPVTALLYTTVGPRPAALAGAGAVGAGALLLRSFRSRRGTEVTPQFTRQKMRRRDRDGE